MQTRVQDLWTEIVGPIYPADRKYMLFDCSVEDESGNTGIVPTNIVGNVIKFADDTRPVFGSLTSRPLPASGKTFIRPVLTAKWNTRKRSRTSSASPEK